MAKYVIEGKGGDWGPSVAMAGTGETKCSEVSFGVKAGDIHQASRASSHLPSISGII